MGSVNLRLNTSGTIIDKEEYYPFGDTSLRTFTYKRYRYVGKEKDAESGLHYYGARYYAAWTCRFISVDPLAAEYSFYTPYQYAGNKPINSIDIDGMAESGSPGQRSPSGGSGGPSGTARFSGVEFTEFGIVNATYETENVEITAPPRLFSSKTASLKSNNTINPTPTRQEAKINRNAWKINKIEYSDEDVYGEPNLAVD